jgi:hypothetical protein
VRPGGFNALSHEVRAMCRGTGASLEHQKPLQQTTADMMVNSSSKGHHMCSYDPLGGVGKSYGTIRVWVCRLQDLAVGVCKGPTSKGTFVVSKSTPIATKG